MNWSHWALLAVLAASPRETQALSPADSAAASRADSVVVSGLVLTPLGSWPVGNLPRDKGQVLDPAGLAVDAFGRVVVADAALHRVQRFDRHGNWLGESGGLGSDAGQMRRPSSVAPLGAVGMAVLDRENRRVLSYDHFGRMIGTVVDLATPELEDRVGRVDPVALAADKGGALFVADPERERVLSFDFSGRFVRALGGFGPKPGSFRGLAAIASTPRGELVVAERGGARVQRLDAAGRALAAWAIPADTSSRIALGNLALAVDDSLRVALADENRGRLWVFDAGGRVLATLDGLLRPKALGFAPDGTLMVAESGAARIRRWALAGR